MEDLTVRKMDEEDIPFVKSTWLAHQSFNEPWKHMNEFEFKSAYSRVLDFTLPHIEVRILCNKEFPEQIYGYIAYFDDILNFIYIKGMYRNMGLSKLLLQEAFKDKPVKYYTHLSDNRVFRTFVRSNNLSFNKFKFN